jgi:hypothetical protein
MNGGYPSGACRTPAGRIGALALTLGIGTALAAGLGMPNAHADSTDGSSSSATRSANDRASRSTPGTNAQQNRRASRTAAVTAPGDTADAPSAPATKSPPASAASRRAAGDGPTAATTAEYPSVPDIATAFQPAIAMSPADVLTSAPGLPDSPMRIPDLPNADVAEAAIVPPGGQTVTGAAQLVSPRPAAAVSAVIASPAPAARVVSPPIASMPLAISVGSFLTSLAHALGGSTPTVPADAAAAVMLGVARRQTAPKTVPAPPTVPVPVATATAAGTMTPAVEAEKMTRSSASSVRVVSDRNASGQSALTIVSGGKASATLTIPTSTALTIRARASAGSPNMTVSIDGVPVTTVVVGSTSYQDYTFAGTIAAGKHVISVSSSNSTSKATLYLDKVSTTTGAIGDQFTGSKGSAPTGTTWSTTLGTGWDPGIQNYTNGGAVLDGQGHLVLQATRGSNGSWTSGRIESANKLSYGYGTITARIKVPQGQGLWPAFWLTGADAATNGWPATGEIDVMELPSTTTTMYSTLHGPISGTTATQQAQIISTLPDLSTDYHNYWVKHLPNQITFGLDGQTLGTLTPADLAPGETWVYNRPMYVLLNLAVGGSWAGAPDSTTPSTAEMLVDSVTFVPA